MDGKFLTQKKMGLPVWAWAGIAASLILLFYLHAKRKSAASANANQNAGLGGADAASLQNPNDFPVSSGAGSGTAVDPLAPSNISPDMSSMVDPNAGFSTDPNALGTDPYAQVPYTDTFPPLPDTLTSWPLIPDSTPPGGLTGTGTPTKTGGGVVTNKIAAASRHHHSTIPTKGKKSSRTKHHVVRGKGRARATHSGHFVQGGETAHARESKPRKNYFRHPIHGNHGGSGERFYTPRSFTRSASSAGKPRPRMPYRGRH